MYKAMFARSFRAAAFILSTVPSLVFAQVPEPEGYERVLFPVVMTARGAFGSFWEAHAWARNDSSGPIQAFQSYPFICSITCPGPSVIGAKQNFQPFFVGDVRPNPEPGSFYYVSKRAAESVHFTLRVQDVSRQAQTWGTEIPVIRERGTKTTKIHLLNVPLDDRFRQTLRIYDFDRTETHYVAVRIYPMDSEQVLASRFMPLASEYGPAPYPVKPAYAQINWFLQEFPELQGRDRVRVEIEPFSPGMRYWAFISVTNNETQHVTIITPR